MSAGTVSGSSRYVLPDFDAWCDELGLDPDDPETLRQYHLECQEDRL